MPALLTLATAAKLCGARSLYAISHWGRLQPLVMRHALGCWATQALDAHTQPLVLDGKALRGIHGEQLPGVRLVALYAPEAGQVLAQAGGQDPRGVG